MILNNCVKEPMLNETHINLNQKQPDFHQKSSWIPISYLSLACSLPAAEGWKKKYVWFPQLEKFSKNDLFWLLFDNGFSSTDGWNWLILDKLDYTKVHSFLEDSCTILISFISVVISADFVLISAKTLLKEMRIAQLSS